MAQQATRHARCRHRLLAEMKCRNLRCTLVTVDYQSYQNGQCLVSLTGLRERDHGRAWIESLRLHIDYFGCMVLAGSDPWVSENKANEQT